MEVNNLKKIVDSIKNVLKELSDYNLEDKKIREKYAEYLVAYELMKLGHYIQILNERDDRKADIYLLNIKKKVEVKSGKYGGWRDEWTDASFGLGKQISNEKFDYCVFVTFNESEEGKVEEILVFTRKELEEVANNPRKELAGHPKTNPCLLLRCRNSEKYKEYMEDNNYKQLEIEKDLNKYPEKYIQRWDKIK